MNDSERVNVSRGVLVSESGRDLVTVGEFVTERDAVALRVSESVATTESDEDGVKVGASDNVPETMTESDRDKVIEVL